MKPDLTRVLLLLLSLKFIVIFVQGKSIFLKGEGAICDHGRDPWFAKLYVFVSKM